MNYLIHNLVSHASVLCVLLSVAAGLEAMSFFKDRRAALLAAWCFLIVWVTLIDRTPGGGLRYRTALFASYAHPDEHAQIFWNIMLFVPVGVLGASFCRWRSVLYGFFFSVSIETTQILCQRGIFEMDDIMHNTLGAFLGSFLYLFFAWIRRRFSRRRDL